MPRNGSGTYSLPGSAFTSGAVIESSAMNAKLSDLAQAMTGSLAKDGQTTPTGNQAMGGFIHTNVGDAALRNQYPNAGQVQDSAFLWGGVAGGSTTALTISLTPSPSAYAAGQAFSFVTASNFTGIGGPATLNVAGIGAKSIYKFGATELATNDFTSNTVVNVVYDGAAFQLVAPIPKNLSVTTLTVPSLSDSSGAVRAVPRSAAGPLPYTLQASDVGKHVHTNTGNAVTVPADVFSVGDVVTIFNNDGASNTTIVPGVGVTMYLGGTTNTGTRTLAAVGLATVLCFATNNFVAVGAGLS